MRFLPSSPYLENVLQYMCSNIRKGLYVHVWAFDLFYGIRFSYLLSASYTVIAIFA